MNIYLGNLKDMLVSMETMMIETDRLTARMEKVKNTIRLICDDLEAESKHMDEWSNQKEREVLEAMELVEIQRSKYQEPKGKLEDKLIYKYKYLIGKNIENYDLSDDGLVLTLILDTGFARLKTYGDCCSETWIESIDNPDSLKGKIISIEDIEMPNLGNVPTKKKECVDQIEYYGLKIITEKGHCVIDYRNDSNGYYGGSIEIDYFEKEK